MGRVALASRDHLLNVPIIFSGLLHSWNKNTYGFRVVPVLMKQILLSFWICHIWITTLCLSQGTHSLSTRTWSSHDSIALPKDLISTWHCLMISFRYFNHCLLTVMLFQFTPSRFHVNGFCGALIGPRIWAQRACNNGPKDSIVVPLFLGENDKIQQENPIETAGTALWK